MLKPSKLLTKIGVVATSGLLAIVFVLSLWGFLSAESFNWNDFGMFILIFAGITVSFWAVFKIFKMINGLGDEK